MCTDYEIQEIEKPAHKDSNLPHSHTFSYLEGGTVGEFLSDDYSEKHGTCTCNIDSTPSLAAEWEGWALGKLREWRDSSRFTALIFEKC